MSPESILQEKDSRKKRLPNFEVLRTLAMLMVVIVHFHLHGLGYITGPVINTSSIGLFNFLTYQFVVIICTVCVNIFVLLSCYFLIGKPFNYARLIKLWVQVVFYAVAIALIAHVIHPEHHGWREVLNGFTPIRSNVYWFVASYVGLVLLAPFLSKTTLSLTRSQYRKFLCVLVLLGCNVVMDFPWGESMGVIGGYSLIWFIVLFFVAGYLRRFDLNIRPSRILLCFIVLVLLVWGYDAARVLIGHFAFHQEVHHRVMYYNGIPFFLSVLLFAWFKSLSIKRNIITNSLIGLAPYVFGVYLIHDNPIVREYLWSRIVDLKSLVDSPFLLIVMPLVTIGIFLFCAGVDYLRRQLFIMLSVDSAIQGFSVHLQRWVNSVIHR